MRAGVCPHPTPEGSRDAGAPLRGAAALRELRSGGGTATWLDFSKKALHDSPPTASASAPWWEIHEKIIILVSGGQGAEAGPGAAPGARRDDCPPMPGVRQAQDAPLPWGWGGAAQIFSWSGFSLGHRGRKSSRPLLQGPFRPLPDSSSGPKHAHVRNPPSPEEQEGMSHGL